MCHNYQETVGILNIPGMDLKWNQLVRFHIFFTQIQVQNMVYSVVLYMCYVASVLSDFLRPYGL